MLPSFLVEHVLRFAMPFGMSGCDSFCGDVAPIIALLAKVGVVIRIRVVFYPYYGIPKITLRPFGKLRAGKTK